MNQYLAEQLLPGAEVEGFNKALDLLLKGGIVFSAIIAIIIALIVVCLALYAFMTRNRSADRQMDRFSQSYDKLSGVIANTNDAILTMKDELKTQRTDSQEFRQHQTESTNQVIAKLDGSAGATSALATSVNTLSTDIGKKLDQLITQSSETPEVMRKLPNELSTIRAKLEELLAIAQRDKRATSEMAAPVPPLPVPEVN